MLPTLFLVLQALAGTSASVLHVRQNGGAVASNIPTQETFNEPARGEGRRVLVYGRPDLALTVLGEPNPGTAVGIAYTLDLSDANSNRQLFDVNLHDDDDEPNQFDYDDDDDELRLRGTQLCVTMSSPGTLTLETCDDNRDDDNSFIQDWEFDEEDNQPWVRIEDDDDDNRCLTASLDGWSDDQAQLTVESCSNGNVNQRFYQVLPGQGAGAGPSGSAAPSGSSTTSATGGGASGSGTPTQSGNSPTTSAPVPSGTSAPGASDTPNGSRPRANMWGRGLFRVLAEL